MTTTARERTTTDRQVSIRQVAVETPDDATVEPVAQERTRWSAGYIRYMPEEEIDAFCWAFLSEIKGDVGGMKSNLGDTIDVLNRMYYSRAPDDPLSWQIVECHETRGRFLFEIGQRYLDAAERLRIIRARLDALDPDVLETLARVYLRPGYDLHEYEHLGSIILRLPAAERAHVRSGDRHSLAGWLASIRVRPAWAHIVEPLKAESERRLRAACDAWMDTWKAGEAERRRKVAVWG